MNSYKHEVIFCIVNAGFSDEVMEKCDVFVTPGAIFGSEGKRYVRITLCCPAELLEKAAQRVRERLNK